MESTRRDFLKSLPLISSLPFVAPHTMPGTVQLPAPEPGTYGDVIAAPTDQAEWPAFREKLHRWRTDTKKRLAYNGSAYDNPQFAWTQSNCVCGFVMMYDLEFFDPATRTYTVDAFLNRGLTDFGGYDSVVLWHAYPRIGIDERNQFDFYRDMPGGLPGVRAVVNQFHAKNVKVFINYNPWDVGTRREGKADIDGLVDLVSALDVDGIFLDTLKEGGADFRSKLDRIRPGIVLEGELAAELAILPTHHLSWAQWFGDHYVPGVLRDKWYERKHIQHQIARWNRDHSTELQQAWMNGSGMMVWENVFGQWMAWHNRDKSTLRTMVPIQRRYAALFAGEGWTPLVDTKIDGVFASLWEGNGVRLWTLVNRHDRPITGALLDVLPVDGELYYDLVAGKPTNHQSNGGKLTLQGELAPRSIGCFVAASKASLGPDFEAFLTQLRTIKSAYRDDTSFVPMTPLLRKITATPLTRQPPPADMVVIKPATFLQTVEVINRECGAYASYPQEKVSSSVKTFIYDRTVHIPHLAVDITPVTNNQFLAFMQATNYRPTEPAKFLHHWQNGRYVPGKENHPVVFVDLTDARAYAAWAGKRLPTEPEWQYAAQGYSQVRYPWGNEFKADCCNQGNDTTPVDAFPAGKSPVGCLDMCGNTWELTESEYADEHNRFCMLKGGSYFTAQGSSWYTTGGPQAAPVSTKFLLLHPGLDRCSTVGFRCVRDLS